MKVATPRPAVAGSGRQHGGRAHHHFVFFFFFYPHHRGELLSLRDIERLHKKPKSDKETRLATAMVSGGIPLPIVNRRWIEGIRNLNPRCVWL